MTQSELGNAKISAPLSLHFAAAQRAMRRARLPIEIMKQHSIKAILLTEMSPLPEASVMPMLGLRGANDEAARVFFNASSLQRTSIIKVRNNLVIKNLLQRRYWSI